MTLHCDVSRSGSLFSTASQSCDSSWPSYLVYVIVLDNIDIALYDDNGIMAGSDS